MNTKKGYALIVAIFLVIVLLISMEKEMSRTAGSGLITGNSFVSSQIATASLCVNYPPTISSITSQSATVGTLYTLQISASDREGDVLLYHDNTSLFDINQSGYISFIPQAGNVSVQSIEIIVEPDSGCLRENGSTTFTLTISTEDEETPPTPPSGGGGGGGGAAPAAKPEKLSFQFDEETLKISLKELQQLAQKIVVNNDGDKDLKIKITNPLEKVVTIYPLEFTLKKGEEQEVVFTFNPKKDVTPNVYFGQVKIEGFSGEIYVKKFIPLVLEIESEKVYFDASLDVSKKSILQGENLKTIVTVFNLRGTEPTEVKVIYVVSGSESEIVYEEEETIIVKDRVSFTKTISLPPGIAAGEYLLSTKIIYLDTFASSTELFSVEAPPAQPTAMAGYASTFIKNPYVIFSIPLMLALIIIIFVALHFIHKKVKKQKVKTIVKQKTIIRPQTVIKDDHQDLKRKIALLKESYDSGYIKKETYEKTKEKLNKIIERDRK